MTVSTLYFVSHVTGSVSTPNNALGAPDGVFTTDTGATSWTSRWRLDTVAGSLVPFGTQTLVLRLRKNTSGGGNPTVNSVVLYQSGSSVATIQSTSFAVTSDTGENLSITFAGSLLSSLVDVDIQIATSTQGGGANARAVQIDAATWTANYGALITADAIASSTTGSSANAITFSVIFVTATASSTTGSSASAAVFIPPRPETISGRRPLTLVQIDQDFCQNTYGVSPCTASGGIKCYNTRKTCQDPLNYDRGTLTLTFVKPNADLPKDENWLPFVNSTSTAPTKINPATGDLNNSALGERGVLTVNFDDAPHTDFIVDPYLTDRDFKPLEKGTFWSKWLSRNYYQNRLVRLYEGYFGDDLSRMKVRHYLIDSIVGPDSSQRVRLTAKDPLKLSEKERSQIPRASTGQVYLNFDQTVDTFQVKRALETDYDEPGVVRIDDEIISYTTITESGGILTFSGCTRGEYGTQASSHDENSTVQRTLVYQDKVLWEGVKELLVDWANIDPIYIDDTEWQNEYTQYLQQFNFTIILSEPISVFDALNQLSQQMPFYIYWDDRANTIRFKATRYYVGDFPIITESDIIENSFSMTTNPRDRISQVWVYHTPRNWAEDKRSNYKGVEINANLELESRDLYDEKKIRIIEGRWLSSAQAFNLTSRLIRANYDNPVYVKMRLDAKDRDLWTGDVVDILHRSVVDFYGEPKQDRYQVISSQEVISGETIEYQLLKLITLAVKKGFYMDVGAPDWATATDLEKESGAWYADVDGLLPVDVPGYEYE
jgi:hypothetical protein